MNCLSNGAIWNMVKFQKCQGLHKTVGMTHTKQSKEEKTQERSQSLSISYLTPPTFSMAPDLQTCMGERIMLHSSQLFLGANMFPLNTLFPHTFFCCPLLPDKLIFLDINPQNAYFCLHNSPNMFVLGNAQIPEWKKVFPTSIDQKCYLFMALLYAYIYFVITHICLHSKLSYYCKCHSIVLINEKSPRYILHFSKCFVHMHMFSSYLRNHKTLFIPTSLFCWWIL